MSQPFLITAITLGIVPILTATIALATSAAAPASRTNRFCVAVASIAIIAFALQRADVRINFTGSVPLGLYLLRPLPLYGARRGVLVVACAPAQAAVIGQRRGYLAVGRCADGTELLLKSIGAVPGDEVDVTAAGVAVNGFLLPHSQRLDRDRSGRTLAAWPSGRYRLNLGEIWLYAANDRSWDSRYWGPISKADIVAEAIPLFVL